MEASTNAERNSPEYRVLESTHPFTQWLRTYLLWARIMGLEPQVFASVSDRQPSVESRIRWQKGNLWIDIRLLEQIPPRLLAILAVRNYIEQWVWRKYLVLTVLFGVVLFVLTLVISTFVRHLLGKNPLVELVDLFVLPVLLELPILLREQARREADDEAFGQLSEPQMFLQAMQTAVEESYRQGEIDKRLHRMLMRLNRLRRKMGEPPLTLQEVKQRVRETAQEQEELEEQDTPAMNIVLSEEE